ncbi:hypothetical protein [Streptomyces sp. NBC_00503]|uniref:hypothetical protein n=1 Tax=Streptomyces sp. NBC_00503 TaxID=2903659 RepID=UPI002E81763C|nr:hypothetical protein [Streptomyces sp. NBC_00503]WUD84258.1 hypothetical protein OG490_28930 [Streptomyces sp. NBC_00503]
MAGTDFGHALGLSRALSGLPLSPLVGGYGELVSAQQTLGLRHLCELLLPASGSLRVLDGVFRVEGPGRRRHVGAGVLRALRHGRPEAAWLLDRLAGIQERDPAALRRILLYQLVHLLHDHPEGHLPATAAGFGVDPAEAAALVRAAAGRVRLAARERAAAESLEDDWRRGRVRSAESRAALLPTGGGDRELAARLAELAARAKAADAALREARRYEDRGDPERACVQYEEAAWLAGDCPRAVRGLVRTYRPEPGDPGPLESVLVPGGVELRWPPGDFAGQSWRVLRLTRGEPVTVPLAEVPGQPRGGVLRDQDAGIGLQVRYVALPLGDDGALDGPPLIGAPLAVAPAVTGLSVCDGNRWIEASWTGPPFAAGPEVALTGPRGPVADLAPGRETLRAEGLEPGAYELTVRARYSAPGRSGRAVLSAAATIPVTVHPWPAPVHTLTASPRESGGLDFHVTRAEGASGTEVRLVEWPDVPPVPGTELKTADLPPPLDWISPGGPEMAGAVGTADAGAGRFATSGTDPAVATESRTGGRGLRVGLRVGLPPGGLLVNVAAVAVLGERAVAGPVVAVEAPLAVTGLALRRTAPDQIQVTFDWPGSTGTVTAAVTQDGRVSDHAVARTVFLREGLRLPVTPAALRVDAYAAPRSARAVLAAAPGDARAELPADVTIAYELLPGARRGLRRGPAVLRVTVRAPAGAADLPGFVLVARADGGRNPRRPSGPSGGTPLCRLTGDELAATGTVERELDPATAPGRPYAVRGFLLGGHAASVRLEEPPIHSLVVR